MAASVWLPALTLSSTSVAFYSSGSWAGFTEIFGCIESFGCAVEDEEWVDSHGLGQHIKVLGDEAGIPRIFLRSVYRLIPKRRMSYWVVMPTFYLVDSILLSEYVYL